MRAGPGELLGGGRGLGGLLQGGGRGLGGFLGGGRGLTGLLRGGGWGLRGPYQRRRRTRGVAFGGLASKVEYPKPQEARRAAPRNSGCGREPREKATLSGPPPPSSPPAVPASVSLRVLRESAAGPAAECSPAASARPAERRARSTAARGPGPRRRRRRHRRSRRRECAGVGRGGRPRDLPGPGPRVRPQKAREPLPRAQGGRDSGAERGRPGAEAPPAPRAPGAPRTRLPLRSREGGPRRKEAELLGAPAGERVERGAVLAALATPGGAGAQRRPGLGAGRAGRVLGGGRARAAGAPAAPVQGPRGLPGSGPEAPTGRSLTRPPAPRSPEAERARPRQARPAAPMEGAVQLLSREGHSVAHNSKRHYHDAFVAMSRMRQRGLLCDIVLHVAAKEIRAHKVVLASCSPYFHAMFTSKYRPARPARRCGLHEMSESRQTHVTLHDIDPQALDQLVQFAYTAEIVVGEGNVQTLLPAASLLQLNGVRDACCKFLLSQLDPSNCLGIRGFADAHSCSDLLKAAHRYVLQHFVDVAKTEEFMLLPLKQVLELVSSDSLNVPSEEEVYRAVLSWVKHDVDARRQHVPRVRPSPGGSHSVCEDVRVAKGPVCPDLPRVQGLHGGGARTCLKKNSSQVLMKCVRLPLLSRDFLLGHVDAESLVRHHPDCKDLLIEALKFHLLPEQRGILGTSRTRPRRCEGAGPVLFAVGGGSLFAIHGDCEAYDTRTDRWHVVASMSTRRARVGVAAVGNRLYAVGGYDGTSDLATVESYDPVTNTWQPEVSMGTRRSCLGVAALHGLLYSAGGYDGASCLNSAERYDPLTGAWTSVAAMSTRRRYVRVATLDGNLYAVGGYDSSSHLATVEKYEPQVNVWSPVASMLSRRSSAGVAVLEGALYVAGGNDGTSCLNSVERYSPKAGAWESVAPMNIRRSAAGRPAGRGSRRRSGHRAPSHGATLPPSLPVAWVSPRLPPRSTHDLVAMDGWLYAVGGNDGSSSLNSIEKYSPRANKWVAASCMFTRRSSVGVAVLELLSFPPPSSPTLSVSSTSL
ncbi:Kelch-like protein 17 [Plecturocebus cupreus]